MQITLRNVRRSENGSDDRVHPTQRATACFTADEAQQAAQDGAQDEVEQNRWSGATAQVAQDQTEYRSNNGQQGSLTIVPPEQEQAAQDVDGFATLVHPPDALNDREIGSRAEELAARWTEGPHRADHHGARLTDGMPSTKPEADEDGDLDAPKTK